MNQNAQEQLEHLRARARREEVREHAARIVGPLDDDELSRLAAESPVFFALVEARADGRLAGGRRVTDQFLRRLGEGLFNYAVALALSFFRQDASGVSEVFAQELTGIATYLYLGEQYADRFESEPTDAHLFELTRRLSRLILLEEQRRCGCFVWINSYGLLRPPTDEWPPRLPITDRKTEH